MELRVIMWTHRDGSVHAEMRLATFPDEVNGEFVTHLDGEHHRSACGLPYFGRISSTGLGRVGAVDCEQCRALLIGKTYVDSGRPDHASSNARLREET